MDTSRLNEVRPPQTPKFKDADRNNLHDALDVLVELQLEEVGQAEARSFFYGFMAFGSNSFPVAVAHARRPQLTYQWQDRGHICY